MKMRAVCATLLVSFILPHIGNDHSNGLDTGQVLAADQSSAIATPEQQRQHLERILEHLSDARAGLEEKIASSRSDEVGRDLLLLMLGRSSAAHGRFARSAAAYATFLAEFGLSHPHALRATEGLIESLAPLNTASITILRTPDGPRFKPQWRMNCVPDRGDIEHAVLACEIASNIAPSSASRGRILLRLGWLYRALDDWPASTQTWQQCVTETGSGKTAANASWLIARNLQLTGETTSAATQLRSFAQSFPDDSRAGSAADLALLLEVASDRPDDWSVNPVASLEAEVARCADRLHPHAVYRSALNWLRNTGDVDAAIDVARWATSQTEWRLQHRAAAHHDLVDVLLVQPTPERRAEAIDSLRALTNLSPSPSWMIPAALKCARLLSEGGDHHAAHEMLDSIEPHAESTSSWAPPIALERIRILLDAGDLADAERLLTEFKQTWPDCSSGPEFTSLSRSIADRKEVK